MYNRWILTDEHSCQSFDLRLPFCDSCHLYRVPFVREGQRLCEVYLRRASKSSLILCLIPSRLTITTWDSEQVWGNSEWGIWPMPGTKRARFEKLQNRLSLCNISSEGHIQAHRGQKPTAVPTEGLTPGPWFNHCPARGEAKQATKLPSSLPSSYHQCSL